MMSGGSSIENYLLPTGVKGSRVLSPEDFAHALGMASWLMTLSTEHKHLPMTVLDERILPAILLKQFRILFKDKMPVVFIGWALVSDEIEKHHQSRSLTPALADWRSGTNLIIIECVSPFASVEKVKADFMATQDKQNTENN